MKILNKIFGDPNKKILKSIQPIVEEINNLEEEFKKMDDSELSGITIKLREKLAECNTEEETEKKLTEILPKAFAAVREASRRKLSMRHYDVQLTGGIILHQGKISEMRTGEGKTLVATLPTYLNALTGKGVHVITVNDYLAKRDAGWMAPIYNFLGLSLGVITHESAFIYDPEFTDETATDEKTKNFRKVERKEAYACDITYGTNNEFGFDYLRDNMVASLGQMAQRDLHYAIIDEVDSILIDEARTPLIISAPAEESTDKYYQFAQLVGQLKENEDYNVDEKMRTVTLSENGISKMEKLLGVENIYVAGGVREVHHIEQALKAQVLFKKEKDYVVQEGQVVIVDEFTGRLMQGRRYSEGLHQAIEAKENLKIQRESQTLATVTFQNYFRMYSKLAGMTGTAATEAEEFAKIYGLETVIAPTNKEIARKDFNDLIYQTEIGKFKAVIEDVKKRHAKGQPVLIGTISIEKNELLSNMMEREGLHPQILNAKNHATEAKIIAQAGKKGSITIATNMAGRGVDIVLGGVPIDNDQSAFANSASVDTSAKEVATADKSTSAKATADKSTSAKATADKEEIKKIGGLHVIGTERHESRRIDNQLRGRTGRQGDPGSSQFFVSTDDDLMRIFGGDRMKRVMQTLKLAEDMPIENKLISRSIESAQRRVEGNNFDVRKHLVEYDDVINKHREAIYKRRREILNWSEEEIDKEKENDKLSKVILEMVENEIEQVVLFHTAPEEISDWNLEEIYEVTSTIFPVKEKLKEDLSGFTKDNHKLDKAQARTALIEHLVKLSKENYAEIKKNFQEAGLNWMGIEKGILIRSIDTLWVEHLESMSHMRQGIGLRGYGQRDPLVEYKKEAYRLYNELNNLIQKQVVYSIFKVGDIYATAEKTFTSPTLAQRAKTFSAPAKTMNSGSGSFSGFKQAGNTSQTENIQQKKRDKEGNKIGRNDPCPCGSGKKYKKCCGK